MNKKVVYTYIKQRRIVLQEQRQERNKACDFHGITKVEERLEELKLLQEFVAQVKEE